MRCITCSGSGRMMGGGMIMKNCHDCSGTGKEVPIDTTDKAYVSAKADICKLDSSITEEEAGRMIDHEIRKISRKKK